MKSFLTAFITLVLMCWSQPTLGSEAIDQFDISAQINQDSSFEITEEIYYNFGHRQKRGIFRDIPIYLYRKTDTGFGEIGITLAVPGFVNTMCTSEMARSRKAPSQ